MYFGKISKTEEEEDAKEFDFFLPFSIRLSVDCSSATTITSRHSSSSWIPAQIPRILGGVVREGSKDQ